MRKLAIFSAAFAAAAAGYVYGLPMAAACWIAGISLALSVGMHLLGVRRLCIVFLGLCAGMVWCLGYQQLWLAPVDRIYGTKQIRTVRLTDQPEKTRYGVCADVEIELQGRRFAASLYGEEALLEAQAGDTVTGLLEAKEIEGGNTYLRSGGTVVRLYARDELAVTSGEATWSVRIRLWLQNQIERRFSGQAGGLVRALLTGDKSGLTESTQNDLSVAGISHAVAVSGMHVSMLLSMVSFLCGGHPRLTAIFGIPLVVLFALMTGASPSAVRAAVMQVLLLAGSLIRREYDAPTALGTAGLLLLLQNPWAVASVSFQLSFAAVAGLLLFAGPIQTRILSLQEKPGRVLNFAAGAISASLSATVLTLPLTVVYFHQISIAAILTNMLALWAVTLVYMFGLLACAVGPVLAVPTGFLADYVLLLCRKIALFPYAAAYPQNLPLMIWAVCAYAAACWLVLGKPRRLLPIGSALTLGLLICLLWGRWSLSSGVLRVLDVGQGQCLLLNSGGATIVVDCGGSTSGQAGKQLLHTLYSGGQTRVDVLVLTHYDEDHAGDVPEVLEQLSVGLVLLPELDEEGSLRQEIEQAAQRAGAEICMISGLSELTFSGGKLTVYPPLSGSTSSNNGICILATTPEYDILVTGDLSQAMEQKLLAQYTLPDVDVLVAGHHGAKTSTSQLLLETVRPELVAISVGENNYYGHPAQETLERITAAGARIRRTDQDGTIVLRTQGK